MRNNELTAKQKRFVQDCIKEWEKEYGPITVEKLTNRLISELTNKEETCSKESTQINT